MKHDDTLPPIPSVSSRKPLVAHRWLWLIIGTLLGILLLSAVRFVTYNPQHTHYHANFSVYINGEQQQFKDAQYYQEVKVCDLGGVTPQARTHMHEMENGVIHVHDDAVTWGQFFENLGWYVGPDFIRTTTTMYQATGTEKLNVVLNGQDLTDVSTITNQVIDDKDRLLVSYGAVDQATLDAEYKTVPSNAGEYDARHDPASCGGSESPTLRERFEHIL